MCINLKFWLRYFNLVVPFSELEYFGFKFLCQSDNFVLQPD